MKFSKVPIKKPVKKSEKSRVRAVPAREAKSREGLTEFQGRILEFIVKGGGIASWWEIGQYGFPEKWMRVQGRGALIGHIDRAATKVAGMVRLPPRDRWGSAEFFYHGRQGK